MEDHLAISAATSGLVVDDLVDHLPAPVVVHRAGGEIAYANVAMARLLAAPDAASLVGRHLTEYVHPDDLAESLPLVTGGSVNEWTSLRLVPAGRAPVHVDVHQIPVVIDGEPAALAVLADVSDRILAEQALRSSEARFRALVQNATDMVVVHRDGRFTYVSPAVTGTLGWTPEELLGEPVASIVHPDDLEKLAARIAARQRGIRADGAGRYRLRGKDGSWRTVDTFSTTHVDDPAVEGVVVNARDVTDAVAADEAMRSSEARHRALVEHLSDVIVVTDGEGGISYTSPGIVRVVGWTVEQVVGGSIFDAIHPDDEERARQQLDRAVAGGPGRYGPERFRYLRADGEWRHFEATGSNRLDDPAVRGLVFVLRDVTDQVEVQEQLRHLALHDPLTGLANRSLLTHRLTAALDLARRQGTETALLVIDLDRFKAVNDRFGHGTGDTVLVELAARMQGAVRSIDTVARLGGDEFAAVLPASSDASSVAHRIAETLRLPVEGVESTVGASIGLALAPRHGDDVDTLLRCADAAMYRAKEHGLGVVVYGD